MNIDDFKSVYASKTPAEKLDLLMVQVDFYGDAKKNYAEAYYGRRNDKDAVYYWDEAIAMIERIKWLRDEIKTALEPVPRLLSYEELCQLVPGDVVWEEAYNEKKKQADEFYPMMLPWPGYFTDGETTRNIDKYMFHSNGAGQRFRWWSGQATEEQRKAVNWD